MKAPYFAFLIFVTLTAGCTHPDPFPESSEPNPVQSTLSGKTCGHVLDATQITRVKAENEETVFACMGWAHGKYRAFQMDYLRRTAAGRTAEIFGTGSLKTDFFLRLLGLREKAKEIFSAYNEKEKRFWWAYAYGVNQALRLPDVQAAYEFREWGYQPEAWHPVDSLSILLLESFNETQASFWQGLREERARERYGAQAKEWFKPYGLPWDASILKTGETYGDTTRRSSLRQPGFDTKEGVPPWAPEVPSGESGSNSWVIGKSRSESGNAWLANDPHLTLSHPPFWFWMHLEAPGYEVVGATVPGVPVVASGFNRKVAWGLTDSYVAVGEIVAIPQEDTHSFVSLSPKVFTKIGPWQFPITFKKFKKSPDGWPVLPIDGPEGKVLVLRWSGLNVTAIGLSALSQIPKSQSAVESEQWLAGVELPSWNYVVADTRGGLAYRAIGLIPRWEGERPFGVTEGGASKLGELDFLKPEEAPHLVNPKRDFIVTANNRQEPTPGPLDRGRAHRMSFRAYRIEELLLARPKHNFESMAKIQCDVQSGDARFVLPKLLAFIERLDRKKYGWGEREERAIAELKKWNYEASPECTACGIFFRWTERMGRKSNLDFAAFYRVLDRPDDFTFLITQSLSQTLDDLQITGQTPFAQWGALHRAYFGHLSRQPDFERFDYLRTGGFDHTINMASSDWLGDHYSQHAGSSHRFLVEMTSPPTAYFAMPGTALDTENKAIRDDGGPWRQWQDCQYKKIEFPFAWEKATNAQTVTL